MSLADRTQSVVNAALSSFTSFDAYKYAVCGVPFREKWNLSIVRDGDREQMQYDRLVKQPRYAVHHLESRNLRATPAIRMPPDVQVINIAEETDRVFDWITVLERAESLILIDSCLANLVEQVNLNVQKVFIPRSLVWFSPVLITEWKFMH